jgi:anti-sigma regulatory factor (Ser/Thr protein kinase)
MDGMKLEYDVSSEDFSSAGEASSSIKKVLRQLGIESSIIRRVAIATYEAEINVAIHSDGGKINVSILPELIEIIARDRGPGIEDVELAMKKGYSTATSAIRELGFGAGMGLPNMKKCSDDFYLTSKVGEFTEVKMIIEM